MLTSEPATSTPIVPTTMRWIHCLAASADFDSTAVIFQMKAKMNASTPIEPTSACPMWIQVLIRSRIGWMVGSTVRNNMGASRWVFDGGYVRQDRARTQAVKASSAQRARTRGAPLRSYGPTAVSDPRASGAALGPPLDPAFDPVEQDLQR